VLKQHSRLFVALFLTVDLAVIAGAWILSYHLRFTVGIIDSPLGVPPLANYLYLLPVISLLWLAIFQAHRLYAPWRGRLFVDEALEVTKAHTVATVMLVASTFFLREFSYSRLVILIFWGTGLVVDLLFRGAVRSGLRALRRRGHNLRRLLVVGTGPLALEVADRIAFYPESGLLVAGFVDEEPYRYDSEEKLPFPFLGTLELLPEIVKTQGIDQVIVAHPLEASDRLERTLKILEHVPINIKVVPDLVRFAAFRAGLEELDGIPIINLSETPMTGWPSAAKRVIDLAVAAGSLVLLSPLLLLLAVAVKVTSKGPIFFIQERMSLDGRVFRMLKFRTMVVNAEEETGPVWAKKDDDRKTRIGTLLRRTSLDELPQLINILKGEMSLVGPRPERPVFVEQFKDRIPRYMIRHRARAGLTGWAQVNGWRGNTSLEKRIEYDLFYIENWSLGFDFKIIWLTIWKGLIHKHAY
jgi:Undecaprenyl-phosphate glucose phosphotransferase